MKARIIAIAVGLIGLWTMSSSQIQYSGSPLSKSYALQPDVYTVTMPEIDVDALLAEDRIDAQRKDIPYRFGYAHMVDYGITNSGTWDTLTNGEKVWRLQIESRGAFSINLIFNRFYLPTGSSMFVYSEDKSMQIGAFTEKNNLPNRVFSTAPVKGERIVIEYNQAAHVTAPPELNLSVVVHAYRNIFRLVEEGLDGFGDSGPCHFNVVCPEGQSWRSQARGVAMVLLSNNTRICSGSLINNVRSDGTPYFLTANHCWDSSQPTWIFMFKYESETCANPTQEPPTTNTISGSTLKARNADSDFCLLQLSSTPPTSYNVYYSGWNRQDVAASSGAGIHHPRGDIKKISFSNSSYVSSTWPGTPANSHWRVNWSQVSGKTAVTEPTSSGSPIFDQNKRIVGQLHGGPSYCDAPSGSLYDLYGKFSMSWDRGSSSSTRLKDWLDPDNTGVTSIDGFDPAAPIQVAIDQKRVDGNRLSGTTVGRWNGSSFTELAITANPDTIEVNVGSREVLRGYQQLVTNPSEKYRVWERNQLEQLDTIQNHRGFTIGPLLNNLTSRFNPTQSTITIRTDLIDAPGTTGGTIQFHDPWYIDFQDGAYGSNWRNRGMVEPRQFHTRSVGSTGFQPDFTTTYPESPNHPYRGVFLNQGFVGQNAVYYSVGAPSPQTIGGYRAYFQKWTGTNVAYRSASKDTSAVVFTASNATAVANYKAPLLSTSSTATGPNSQRKVATLGSVSHAVYESGGSIWYLRNDGTGWSNERLIYWSTTARDPSIATTTQDPVGLHIAWEDGNWIKYCYSTNNGLGFSQPVILGTGTKPVCAGGIYMGAVVWHDGRRLVFKPEPSRTQGLPSWDIPLTDNTTREYSVAEVEPSSCVPGGHLGSSFHVTYIQGNGSIFVRRITVPLYNQVCFQRPWSPPLTPSITTAGNAGIATSPIGGWCISWDAVGDYFFPPEESDPTGPTVTRYRRVFLQYAQNRFLVLSIANTDNVKPSVGFDHTPNGRGLSVVWQYGNNGIAYFRFDTRRITHLDYGNAPTLAPSVVAATNTLWQMWTGLSGPPYRIHLAGPDPMPIPVSEEDYSREVMAAEVAGESGDGRGERATAYVRVAFTGPKLKLRDGSIIPLNLVAVDDSLPNFNEDTAWDHLASERVTLTSAIDSIIIRGKAWTSAPVNITGRGHKGLRLNLHVVDAETGDTLQTLGKTYTFSRDTVQSVRVRDRLRDLTGREVIFRPSVKGIARGRRDIVYKLVEAYTLSERSNVLASSQPASRLSAQEPLIPAEFALQQNYPNPFNPSTVIRYQLPEDAFVSLKVYDMLGREVAVLVDEPKEAGYYEAVFDASSLSSGVYLYRMRAGSYNAVRKLLVLR